LPRLILFDDESARDWEPFALTRPIGELLFGVMTLRARSERVLDAHCVGHLTGDHLVGFDEPGTPPVLDLHTISTEEERIFLLSRFVPAWRSEPPKFAPSEGAITDSSGRIVGWFSPAGAANPPETSLLRPGSADLRGIHSLDGELLRHPWDLVVRNPEQIAVDVRSIFPPPVGTKLPADVLRWGEHPLVVDPTAAIEPGSAFDTSKGPIWLDHEAEVRAFSRLAGPAYIGPGSIVLGGAVEAVSLGPMCRVRGELAESVCIGYVNKQHDGHMGHAYLGRWVNLGAGTTNSDLKNNYGTIRVWTPRGEVDTGLVKMGSMIGDHVKTGIGLLLNTGTVIGAGSNLFGGAMPPTNVPPFSWGSGRELVEYRLDKFIEVAERVMSRRGIELSQSGRRQLEQAWHRAREREDSSSSSSTVIS
jgi:UDP-N-acetylglucosamine diphosphorylase / glucose-1-phosphate thymidylyltransferase / UDP-N-acetylgalactosamine diphosphorylase / glucosamine-1-phosphate N-acetyltransferase / galactosamine-1-phosphate N-acetyltransferase